MWKIYLVKYVRFVIGHFIGVKNGRNAGMKSNIAQLDAGIGRFKNESDINCFSKSTF